MANKESRYLRVPKCTGHSENSYTDLWRLSFTPKAEYVSCGENCSQLAVFKCHCWSFAIDGEVLKSQLVSHNNKKICPCPHLTFETCIEAARLCFNKSVGRPRLIQDRIDHWLELRAYVFEKGCLANSIPEDPFFTWLDGRLKNRWQEIEDESCINEGEDDERKYQIFALTWSGEDISKEERKQRTKEIKKELDLLRRRVAPTDSPEDAKLLSDINILEEKLAAVAPKYEGAAEYSADSEANVDKMGRLPSPDPTPLKILCREEDMWLLKDCLGSLKQHKPQLHAIVDITIKECDKVATRKTKEGGIKFNDQAIARLLNIPVHTARRGIEAAEKELGSCMKRKGFRLEELHG